MPTNPPEHLYNPDRAVAEAQPLADVACPALSEIISYGSAVLERCRVQAQHNNPGEPIDEDLVVLARLHDLLQMLDSVNELIRRGRSVGLRPPLRTAFEALLAIEYLLKEPARLAQRARAFIAADMLDWVDWYEAMIPGTEANRELEASRVSDSLGTLTPLPDVSGMAGERDLVGKALAGSRLAPAAADLRAGRRGRTAARWYSAHGGPTSLWKLAEEVGRPYQYRVLYSDLSSTSHSGDLRRVLTPVGGEGRFARFPSTASLAQMCEFAMAFGIQGTRKVLLHYRDEAAVHRAWYEGEIRAAYLEVCRMDLDPV
jgi:hypothetical protein